MISSQPIDLQKIKRLIHYGVLAIPQDKLNKQSVLVIGDTGVGKTTIMAFLSGAKLIVRDNGLKPTLDYFSGDKNIAIGHGKFSETTVPNKVQIQGMAFYDCPGFRDNKGQQYEISNSFFVQRLLDIYEKVKIVLVVTDQHISESRPDKLPKLIKNIHTAFVNLEDIIDGVVMIINKASIQNSQEDYHKQIKKMVQSKHQDKHLFTKDESYFLNYLIQNKRVKLFSQPRKEEIGHIFTGGKRQQTILKTIKECSFVKTKKINKIISESAKLAIREFLDQVTIQSNLKIEHVCEEIIHKYQRQMDHFDHFDHFSQNLDQFDQNLASILQLKQKVIKLADEIKNSKQQNIIDVLQREVPQNKIQDFRENFAAVLFFKDIYDKTAVYFSNLINKIYAQLSELITKFDKKITTIQKIINEQRKVKQQMEILKRNLQIQMMKEEKSQIQAAEYILEGIQKALKCLKHCKNATNDMKKDVLNLKKFNQEFQISLVQFQSLPQNSLSYKKKSK